MSESGCFARRVWLEQKRPFFAFPRHCETQHLSPFRYTSSRTRIERENSFWPISRICRFSRIQSCFCPLLRLFGFAGFHSAPTKQNRGLSGALFVGLGYSF